jgi:hypothetical protein
VAIAKATIFSSCSKHTLRILHALHLLKICRLMRVLHLKSVKDFEYKSNLGPSTVRLCKLVFAFLLVIHWVACAYWAIVLTEGFRMGNDHDENFWLPVSTILAQHTCPLIHSHSFPSNAPAIAAAVFASRRPRSIATAHCTPSTPKLSSGPHWRS